MIRSIINGAVAAVRAWKLTLTLYVLSLALALPLALSLKSVLETLIGSTLASPELMGGFEYSLFSDFMAKHSGRVRALIGAGIWGTMAFGLLSALLGGGVVTTLASEGRATWKEFWSAVGEFLGRMVRMYVLFVVLCAVAAVAISIAAGAVIGALDEGGTNEKPVVTGVMAVLGAAWLLGMFVIVWFEAAKILMVTTGGRRVFRALGSGFVLMWRKVIPLVGLQLLMAVVQVLLMAAYLEAEGSLAVDTAGGVVVLLLLQQILIGGRILVKVWNTGSLVLYIKGVREAEDTAPVVEVVAPPAELPPAAAAPEPFVSASEEETKAPARKRRVTKQPSAVKKSPRSRSAKSPPKKSK